MLNRKLSSTSLHQCLFGHCFVLSALSIAAVAGEAPTGDAPGADRRIDDNEILEAVEGDLRFDGAVPEHQIDVQVREGIVTLSGRSDTLLGKQRAQLLVESLRGVRACINQIRVLPSGRSDSEILKDVRAALAEDPVADLDQLRVQVVEGVVQLQGKADSYAESVSTEKTAAGIRGVLGIENQIAVEVKQNRPDNEIRPEIQRRLANSPWLAAGLIQVTVRDGHVTLRGTVGSVHEKSVARARSWVAGVRSVDDRQLDIKWWLDRHSLRDSSVAVRNDVQIQRAVEDALLYDPRLRGANVKVHVRRGAVSLFGSVSTLRGKQAAEEDAQNTVGVRRVMNHLKVKRAEWPGDTEVTCQANEAVKRDAVLSRYDVQASSHFGKVFLRGEVNHAFEKHRAATVVANVPGVLRVVNRVSFDEAWEPKPDEDIKEDVVRRLRWSPLLDAEQVHVAVADGVVTLMGAVATRHARATAERHAFQGGARRVVNHLKVRSDRTHPNGLKATLIPMRDAYGVKKERTGEAFRRLLRTAERSRQYDRLPPAPEVELLFQLQNDGDLPLDVWLGHDSGGFEMVLAGDGAEHVTLARPVLGDFRLGRVVTVEPGGKYGIPIHLLQYGFRGVTDRWYWTELGKYTLQVTLTWPAERTGLFGEYAVTASPVELTVKPE
jgi:osmotically-inducible protein OsmY